MIRYKFDVMARLAAAGYTRYRLRKEKIMGESSIQRLLHREPIKWEVLSSVCDLLDVQPGDVLEYTPGDDSEKEGKA